MGYFILPDYSIKPESPLLVNIKTNYHLKWFSSIGFNNEKFTKQNEICKTFNTEIEIFIF